jgi:hypothetical protein
MLSVRTDVVDLKLKINIFEKNLDFKMTLFNFIFFNLFKSLFFKNNVHTIADIPEGTRRKNGQKCGATPAFVESGVVPWLGRPWATFLTSFAPCAFRV